MAYSLFDAIIRQSRDFEIVVFADPAFKTIKEWAQIPRTTLIEVPFATWSRNKSQLWEQIVLPWQVKQLRCDLVHHPIGTCPRWDLGTKTVVTLHDLNFYHHPEWVAPAFRRWLMHTAVPGMRRAKHVVTISDYVLADARKTLHFDAAKTSRIYNGLRPMTAASGRKNGDAPDANPVILGVNLWQPHKNLPRLLEALKILRTKIPFVELHLAGRPQANYKDSPKAAAALEQPGVTVLGYLSETDLIQAYADAAVFCYPSLEEGFGLPILEAMTLGTPVVTSDASCLPEIAGGAAILVDPLSPEAIAAGLYQALSENEAARETRVAAGKKVAGRFTWNQAAADYSELYQRLVA